MPFCAILCQAKPCCAPPRCAMPCHVTKLFANFDCLAAVQLEFSFRLVSLVSKGISVSLLNRQDDVHGACKCFWLSLNFHLCPTLQADLAAKYVDIFHKYGLDLEEVQKLYEKHKHSPPVVRNAPPVAGNIMWARQLLRRIEVPMTRSV